MAPRRKAPAALKIDPPTPIALPLVDPSTDDLSEESEPSPSHNVPRLSRNTRKLSITLPSPNSPSLSDPHSAVSIRIPDTPPPPPPLTARQRRPSVASLPAASNPALSFLHRKDEDAGGSPTVPYADGPTQIIPGIWLGSEENARDWKGLVERGIRSILNVAKEVVSPFDSVAAAQPLRAVASTPNFNNTKHENPTYCPPHPATGRPAMHYLKLQWSHGQQDLVDAGFQDGMAFADAALLRDEGVLIHCQCGISRSATMVIALVMRAAAERSPNVPPEVWALKGMQAAYAFVKEKSRWVGPNMSLIYQLLEYEKKLKGDNAASADASELSSLADEEEEWGRRRKMLDDTPSDDEEEDEQESNVFMQEARALDKAMEDRIVARKASASSIASSGSGIGMGTAWRSRYGARKRAGSIASNNTNGSVLSEDLLEEEEEQSLLNIGGGFDDDRRHSESSVNTSPGDEIEPTPRSHASTLTTRFTRTSVPRLPPSAPAWKTSFQIPPPPATASRATFDLPPPPRAPKRRPPALGFLPPVPSSPVTLILEPENPSPPTKLVIPPLPRMRKRTESRKLAPPPLHLRSSALRKSSAASDSSSIIASTPSQTLFVFPPSPTLSTRTPSTMTLTTNLAGTVPFPSLSTPRVSSFRSHGRTRSFIGVGAPPTPTTAFSKVDARGYVGLSY